MADLPPDRLETRSPHLATWEFTPSALGMSSLAAPVVDRQNSKRWAVLFTCLTTRAVHLEVIEELSTSSFINAVRRFYAIRGPVEVFRSDCETNFVRCTNVLKEYLLRNGTVLEIPPSSFITHGWSLGMDDWCCSLGS